MSSDSEEENYKYKINLIQDAEEEKLENDIENGYINFMGQIRDYLGQRGSILYPKVRSSKFGEKVYEIIHEIINLKK